MGPGSDLSEEPVFRMLSRSRWTFESFLNVLPDPPVRSDGGRAFGVCDEVSVDPVGDPAFQCPDRLFVGFTFDDLAVIEHAAFAGVRNWVTAAIWIAKFRVRFPLGFRQ